MEIYLIMKKLRYLVLIYCFLQISCFHNYVYAEQLSSGKKYVIHSTIDTVKNSSLSLGDPQIRNSQSQDVIPKDKAKILQSSTQFSKKISQKQTNDTSISVYQYIFLWTLVVMLAFCFTAIYTGMDVNLKNIITFFIQAIGASIAIAITGYFAYMLLKFIWEEIIFPILAGIFFFVMLAGCGGNNNKSEGEKTYGDPCSYYDRSRCEGCPKLNTYDHKYVSRYVDLHRCDDLNRYVDPNKSPKENIEGY